MWRRVASGVGVVLTVTCLAAPPAGAAAGPRTSQILADEAVPFHRLVVGVLGGANDSYIALRFADGASSVLAEGQVTMTIPPQGGTAGAFPVTLIPDTYEVDYALEAGGGAPRFYLSTFGGTLRYALPACIGSNGIETLYANEIAWWCGSRLYLATVTGGTPAIENVRSYNLPDVPLEAPHSFAVNPDTGLVAVRGVRGVTVLGFRGSILSHIPLPGALLVSRMTFSPRGVLAVETGSAVLLWSQPFGLRRFAVTPATGVAVWAPDGVSLLVNTEAGSRGGARLVRIARLSWDGTSGTVASGNLGFLLGFSADGSHVWREEGVSPGVYATPSRPGPGPFHLSLQPLPPLSPAGKEPLPAGESLAMAGPDLGWMVIGEHLLRTTDGGTDWTEITPPGYLLAPWGSFPPSPDAEMPFYTAVAVGASAPATFLHAAPCASAACYMGWVFASPADGTGAATILFTPDGGTHWENLNPSGMPPSQLWREPFQLEFTSKLSGWLMVFPPCCLDDSMHLYRTLDGGRHWLSAIATPPSGGLSGTALRYGNTVAGGMGFLNTLTGWITGTARGAAWMLATTDGGLQWTPVRLSVPAQYSGDLVMTLPPHFFGTESGVLPVDIGVEPMQSAQVASYLPQGWQEVFSTHDDGGSWTPGTVIGSGTLDVLDAGHMWHLTEARLLESTNSGGSWQTLTREPQIAYPFAFTNATDGFGMQSQVAAGGTPPWTNLVRTTDAGRTWRPAPTFLDCPTQAPPASQERLC